MRERSFKVLQQQAYDYIKDLIHRDMDYQKIYSESKLALEMGISRTPVRDAVHRLYQENLVDVIPNKGFILHRVTQRDIMEHYEVRSAIEGYCARKAAHEVQTEAGQELLQALEDSLERQREIFNFGEGVEAFAQEDQKYHGLFVSYSGNTLFEAMFGQYMYQVKRLACYSLKKEHRMKETIQEHQHICEAIRQGNEDQAYDAMSYHMKAPLDINLELVYEKNF